MAAANLDTSWIDDYEDIEKKYEMFYKENIASINVIMIYVNDKLEIEKISQRDLDLNTYNVISKDEILDLVNTNSSVGDIKYSLLSLLTYNINLGHSDLKQFLESDIESASGGEFLHSLTSLQDIKLNPSIQLFQDINSLVVVYYEKSSKPPNSKTKHSTTKKVYIHTKSLPRNKKTKRHR